jgi:small subunit ribosomal protein S20
LANIASAKKRARQSEVNRERNASMRSKFRTFVKRVVKALEAKDATAATSAYNEAVPVIDSMVNKNIIHRNKAARHKSRLSAQIKALG